MSQTGSQSVSQSISCLQLMAQRKLKDFHLLLLLLFSVFEDVVQSENCGVIPTTSRYRIGSLYEPALSTPTCTSSQIAEQMFYTCSQSSITNGLKGPSNYSDATRSDYLRWNAAGGQIEFNFSQRINFTKVQVFFYVNTDPDLALPKLRFLGEAEGELPECTTGTTSGNNIVKSLDLLTPHNSPTSGLQEKETNLDGTSSALLLCILPAKNYNLALTEIKFCTNGK